MSNETTPSLDSIDDDVSQPNLRALLQERRLLPLLPLLYIAWANGELTPTELATLRDAASSLSWLDDSAAQALEAWLNPAAPPSARELASLLRAIERASRLLDEEERVSLVELGVDIANQDLAAEPKSSTSANIDEIRAALRDLESALGLVGVEAARQLRRSLSEAPSQSTRPLPAQQTFNVAALTELLDGDHGSVRNDVRRLLASDQFEYAYGLSLPDYRARVVQWLKTLAAEGYGEKALPLLHSEHPEFEEFLAIFETLGTFDLSLLVKFGVQFGLFGGSIMFLGTERHHREYLPRIASLQLQGCYAMTEMGRGSNVRDLETTAHFDADTDEFVIHTPTETARKEWIGGAGQYATLATVYAQLHVGGEEYGVHAFLVPIRDDNGNTMPGVRIEDQGWKMGLNGVDNGRIWFDQVRIPRDNLLDRYGRVTDDGHYESPIASTNRRFFTMLGTLVAGRLGITAAGLSAARTALTIAIRYGAGRRQFGPVGEPEIPILNYRMHQRALLPHLATSYALCFGLQRLIKRFNSLSDDERRPVEALAAGLKAYGSWFALDAVQQSRECCGGQGYLTLNRLPSLRTDVDVFATFEGANVVMMQQVAKASLSEFTREMSDGNLFTMAKLLASQAARTLSETNPVVVRNTDPAHLRSPEFQLDALRYRADDLKIGLARRLKKRIDKGMDSFLAFNDCQDHAIALANAHVESFLLESFIEAEESLNNDSDKNLRTVLSLVRNLFALSRIEADSSWFLENNYLQSAKARAVRDQVNLLCEEVRHHALSLVDAFAIPDEVLSAPIAFADGKAPAEARQQFARGVESPAP